MNPKKITSKQPSGPHPAFISALRNVLKPLILLMIRNGIGFPFLSQMLKGIFLESAQEECGDSQKPLTDSRLSLLTGVHRKDIRRLKNEPPEHLESSKSASLGAHLISLWITKKEFLDANGKPKPLPRLESQTKGASFESLVKTFSVDIRSRAVLDEWMRLGVVTLNEDDQVCLQTDAFVPKAGFEEKSFFFGQNISDHIRAASHNLQHRTPPLFDRSVYYNGLSEESIRVLEDLFNEAGMDLLKRMNAKAMELQEQDKGRQGNKRFNAGMFFYKGNGRDETKK